MLFQSRARFPAWLCLVLVIQLVLQLTQAQKCKGKQSYIFSVTTSFTPNVDPQIPQEKARIPVMVAVAHTKSFTLFSPGLSLTDAVAEIATTGTTSKIIPILDELRKNKTISSYEIIAEAREDTIPIADTTRFDLEVRDESTLISIIAPLSPSPSWFVGIRDINLCTGNTKESGFVAVRNNIIFQNFNAGLQRGSTFESNEDPIEIKAPVSKLTDNLNEMTLAVVSLEQGSLNTNWWQILLGVLVGVTVISFAAFCIYPRLRKKKPDALPLTTNEGVEW